MSNKIERMGDKRSPPFREGESGNPGGYSKERRARDAAFRDYINGKTEDCKTLVDRLLTIARQDDDLASANKAIGMLLDRGIGKVREHIEIEGGVDAGSIALVIAARMTPHERAQKLAELKNTDGADEG